MHEPTTPRDHVPDEVSWRLERCDGFLDLRMPDRAGAELDAIPAEHQRRPDVQRLRLRLLIDRHDWPAARELAQSLRDSNPKACESWIQLAYTTRRARSLADAQVVLSEAVRRFPDVSVIRFNLACYACQSGRLDEARRYLHQAFILDRSYREAALEDEDLRPLWPDLEDGRI